MRCTMLVLAALAAACGDQPTEVLPERHPLGLSGPGTVALATSSSEDGLSITTDKDDYQPGDTVFFTGTGWPANDTLDILLEDEPATHEPHQWWVPVAEDGTFNDSTYVVDVDDFGVTFTLTATSRATARSLTVIFTDGNLSLSAPTTAPGFQSVPFSPLVATNVTLTASVSNTPANQPPPNGTHTNVRIRVRTAGNLNPTPPTLWREFTIGSLGNGQSGSALWDGADGSSVAVPDGLYGVRALSSQTNEPNGQSVAIVVDRTAPTTSFGATQGVSPASVIAGSNTPVTLTATATDPTASGVSATHYRVLSARFQLNGAPAGGTAMGAEDGNFNEQIEELTAVIPGGTVAGLGVGTHLLCVRATDAAGNAGAFTITGNPNCVTLEITSADAEPPTIDCDVPDQSAWYADNVTVNCTASDGGSGLQNSSDASFSLSTSVGAGTETATAQTTSRQVCDNNANCATAGPHTFMVDRRAPVVSCGAADGLWHADNVSIGCTATDGGSGLPNPADASFNLSTSVASGVETNNASTDSRSVADAVGNSATAGPISANMIDRKAPVVTLTCPASPLLLNASVTANWSASEGGSGFAGPSLGTVPVPTGVIGPKTVAVAAEVTEDNVGNKSAASNGCGYSVNYAFSGFFAPVDRPSVMNVSKAGQAIPLKWRLTDANGVGQSNLTAVSVKVTSLECSQGSSSDNVEEYAPGSSGLQNLGDGNYQFNWKTPGGYSGTCKKIALVFGTEPDNYTEVPSAYFTFKK